MTQFKLKSLSSEAIERALKRAEHYRFLNDPVQAESICRDVLATDAGNQSALITLILALTDEFKTQRAAASVKEARKHVGELVSEYHRLYYSGIIAERQARAYLSRSSPGHYAYDALREAMKYYEEAERLHSAGDEDAVLRWNSCVRTIQEDGLEPEAPGQTANMQE